MFNKKFEQEVSTKFRGHDTRISFVENDVRVLRIRLRNLEDKVELLMMHLNVEVVKHPEITSLRSTVKT